MTKRLVFSLLLFCLSAKAYAFNDNEWLWRAGAIRQMSFKITTASDSFWVETAAQRDALVNKLLIAGSTPTVTSVSQDPFDISISTTLSFNGFDDFRNTMTQKSSIVDKLSTIGGDAVTAERIQAKYPTFFPVGIQAKIDKLWHQVDLLLAKYAQL